MFRRWTLGTLVLGSVLTATGCGGRLFHHKKRCDPPPPPRDDRSRDLDVPPGVIPPRGTETIPPASLPTTPAPRVFDPAVPDSSGRRLETFSPPRLQEPSSPFLPPAVVPKSSGELPSTDTLPVPFEARKFPDPKPGTYLPKKWLLAPEDPESKSAYTPDVKEGLPQPDRKVVLDPIGPGASAEPPDIRRSPSPLPTTDPTPTPPPHTANAPSQPPAPAEANAPSKPPTPVEAKLPVGLPGFTEVSGKEQVASGRKPSVEGLNWLQKNGYRTVVYLHDPNLDTKPATDLCQARGMRFIGIPVSADRMKEVAAAFDAAVADTRNRPLYMCDDSGLWAGTLWYAHFRTVDLINPDAAKVRANGLGLDDPSTSGEQKKLWDAVQDYLRAR